ncbi:MAG: HvfB family MNIO-type RiPP peptide maturase [Gammaproteobacteria bacterium]
MQTTTPPGATASERHNLTGAGLGLRRALMSPLADQLPSQISFLEVAPENWINVGGKFARRFREILEHYPLICHGLSLSIGSPAPLDHNFLKQLKSFLHDYDVQLYSEHLSYCSDDGHLYDLMPIPFTDEAVKYVADRIRQVQDILERRLIIENVSYYAAPSQEMDEIDFLNAVLTEADCDLLLDVNNIYVNSINHRYKPEDFLCAIPAERVAYFHVAGHYHEAEDLRVDTHAAPVIDPVWELLDKAYAHFGPVPTLLERDFNIPPLEELLTEVDRIRALQTPYEQMGEAAHG